MSDVVALESNFSGHEVTFRGGSIISHEDFRGYWEVVSDAFAVHIGKEKVRRGLWKEYEAKDQFNQIKIKSDRIQRTLELIASGTLDEGTVYELKKEIENESHDIINYITFGLRQL